MMRRPPSSPPFPYTPPSRSSRSSRIAPAETNLRRARFLRHPRANGSGEPARNAGEKARRRPNAISDEHTSELQSPHHIVSRLLLPPTTSSTQERHSGGLPAD